VGMVKKSLDTKQPMWFLRNVFPFCDGGLRALGRYFATVASATAWPSSRSSDTMRGAPQVGLSRAVR
jgi:hypothetical protein